MPMLRRDFHFGGRVVRVEADPAPLRWLQRFVEPQFLARDADAPDQTIRLIVDGDAHAHLTARGPDPGQLTRPCFTLDSGIVSGRLWRAADEAELVYEEARDVFYQRVSCRPGVVDVVTARDTEATRVALMRVVREYAMQYASRAGWVIVHAAAVAFGADAFVIAGPKKAGKTTLLLHALCNEGGAYVSNDRVALRVEPSGVVVHGIPTIMSIRPDSEGWFPGLARKLERAAGDARFSLPPGELCAALDVESRASARVAALLYPEVDTRSDGMTFEALAGPQTLEALRGVFFRRSPEDGMFRIDSRIGTVSDQVADQIVARVPAFRCRLGVGAYREGAGALSALRASGLAATPPPRRMELPAR
jgi:hypothetical protein